MRLRDALDKAAQDRERAIAERAAAARAPLDCLYGTRYTEGCCDGEKVRCTCPSSTPSTSSTSSTVVIYDSADRCLDCAQRLPAAALHIGAVITSHDEGAELIRTVASLARSMLQARLTIFVIDDGSAPVVAMPAEEAAGKKRLASPPNAKGVKVSVVLKRTNGIGLGNARNLGWQFTARPVATWSVSMMPTCGSPP